MNDLIKQVTPNTRGIIWLVKDEASVTNAHYSEIDYLLDGLLTANLKHSNDFSSRVIVGQNFNQSIYVMIIKNIIISEVESFVALFNKNLVPENEILVIDESDGLKNLKNILKPINNHLRVIQ